LVSFLWWPAQSPVFFLGLIFPKPEIKRSSIAVFLKSISWIFFLQKKHSTPLEVCFIQHLVDFNKTFIIFSPPLLPSRKKLK